ncbi:MAG: hypothetical protein ACD_24C00511G0002 [uncultured bacterium]|uniref:Uncharacterized protein n=1 Tax=candidate division WWE3 bacterium RBG_16_37_10 TaxID=1802610 RepID=A0A1F4V1G6_UNCKA|nr:MAG: hypothetical protein ACD_24C00511G0002 [uncultured bacterium]OGC51055.1 MAG: hypothetical protein A2W32_02315 [candidate division WWE3 bacterium RBG_16_37_10]
MPVLSVVFGDSSVSFLFLDSLTDYKFYNFPYIYSHELFISQCTEGDFYAEMLEIVCKSLNKDLKNYKVILGGYPETPSIHVDHVFEQPISDIINYGAIYHAVLINNTSLISPSSCFSAFPTKYSNGYSDDEGYKNAKINYFANLNAFPMYKPGYGEDPTFLIEKDNIVRLFDVSPKDPGMEKDKFILFSGERFLNLEQNDSKPVLLCLDLIKKPGIFQIKIDKKNIYPTMALAQAYDQTYENLLLDTDFMSLCPLINAPGQSEFLIYSENSESKYMELPPDNILFLPATENVQIMVKIKNTVLGNVEKYIKGGTLGLIVDTRDKSNEKLYTKKYISKNIKEWISIVDKSLCMHQF